MEFSFALFYVSGAKFATIASLLTIANANDDVDVNVAARQT